MLKGLCLSLFGCCLYIFSCASYAGATNWIDFELDNGHIKIPIVVSGIEGKAILDTGATINAINRAFIIKNNLKLATGEKVRIQGAFGTEDRKSYHGLDVKLFGVKFPLNNVIESNIGSHENIMLLGSNFFTRFIIQFDYPNKKMRLISRGTIDLAKIGNVEMRREKGSGLPIVNVKLNDEASAWLIFDTGNSSGLMLKRSLATGHDWLEKYPVNVEAAEGVNKVVTTQGFSLPTIQLGPFTLENVLASVPADGESTNLSFQTKKSFSRLRGYKVKGLLGYDILKHFIVTIDYKGGYLHLATP